MEVQDEDDFILGRRYNVLEKFSKEEYLIDHGFVKEMEGKGVSVFHSENDNVNYCVYHFKISR